MSDSAESGWAQELWPDDGPDPDWPGDWPEDRRTDADHWPMGSPVPVMAGVSQPRGHRYTGIVATAAIALAAGAGAVYVYQHAVSDGAAGPAPAVTGTATPGVSPGGAAVTIIAVLAAVVAIGRDRIRLAGPEPHLSAPKKPVAHVE